MKKEDYKKILMSILIGAFVAFFSTLSQGLLDFVKAHGNDIIGGVAATITYLISKHRV